MTAQPWMKFYPQDWRADEKLRMCSLAARGLWIEMLALMHRSDRYGQLLIGGQRPTPAQLAMQVGALPDEVERSLEELEAAGVFSRTGAGTIYSRRMNRDHKRAENSRKNGRKGGNPALLLTDRKTDVFDAQDNPRVNRGDKAQIPEARGQRPESPSPRPIDQGSARRDDAASPPDPAKALWDDATAYLGDKARGQVGKWIKDHGMPAVRAALDAARKQNEGAGADNPAAYIAAALRNGAEREAQRLEDERRAQASFDRRFPPRVMTEDEARALMEPDEFARWQQRRARRPTQTVDPEETDCAA